MELIAYEFYTLFLCSIGLWFWLYRPLGRTDYFCAGYYGGVSSLVIGLIVGGLWGLIAQLRGSWVWVKP